MLTFVTWEMFLITVWVGAGITALILPLTLVHLVRMRRQVTDMNRDILYLLGKDEVLEEEKDEVLEDDDNRSAM